jgi:hypothetical protein
MELSFEDCSIENKRLQSSILSDLIADMGLAITLSGECAESDAG